MKGGTLPIVYTSFDGLELEKVDVKPISSLSPFEVEWITETGISLLEKRSEAELKAKEELSRLFSDVQEQVFFRINTSSYFVDFFIPKYNLVIEIDGGYHLGQRKRDKRRDKKFNDIGIVTIRVGDIMVLEGLLKDDLLSEIKRLQRSRKLNREIIEQTNRAIEREMIFAEAGREAHC